VKATNGSPGRTAVKCARVLVADDHDVVRRGLRAVLADAGHEVCGEASNGRDAVLLARELLPDVVVLDLSMPDLNGLEAARQITAERPGAEVLVLTMNTSESMVRDVLAAGARGYVLKSDLALDLVAAVESLAEHRTFFTPSVGEMVLSGFRSPRARTDVDADEPMQRLTPREREIVQLIAEGGSTKEIAKRLGISVKTVETHRSNVLRSLGLHSVGEIVRYAIRNGIASV
jgi:DNA-binding NarL/FixJ family response regulator